MGSIFSTKLTQEQHNIILFLSLYASTNIVGKVFSILDVPLENTDPKDLIIEYNLSRFFTEKHIYELTKSMVCLHNISDTVFIKTKFVGYIGDKMHNRLYYKYSINDNRTLSVEHDYKEPLFIADIFKSLPEISLLSKYVKYIFTVDGGMYKRYYNENMFILLLNRYLNTLDNDLEKVSYFLSDDTIQCIYLYGKVDMTNLTVKEIYNYLYDFTVTHMI